jgi:hypothetical protein
MKRTIKLFLFSLFSLVLLASLFNVIPVYCQEYTTYYFLLKPNTGYYVYPYWYYSLEKASSTWLSVWNATTGDRSASYLSVGAGHPVENQYYVIRSFVYFDTSELADKTIVSAELDLRYLGGASTNINITVQSSPTYPHEPLQLTDFWRGYYTSTVGSKSTSEFSGGWLNITISDLNCINKTGTTKFILRQYEYDVESIAPPLGVKDLVWSFYSFDDAYTARLKVVTVKTWNYVESWNGILHAIGWYAVESWLGSIVGKCWSFVESWFGSLVGWIWSLIEVWRGVFPELPMFFVRSVMLYAGLGGLFCFMPLLGFAGKKRSLILLLFAFVLLIFSWALLYIVSVTSNY